MTQRAREIADNLAEVRGRIENAAIAAERAAAEINLIVVTKTFPVADLEILYDLGLRNFGENRDQEAAPKAAALADDIHWHFQGQIQSKKLPSILSWAKTIHSIDQYSHASKVNEVVTTPFEIFVQVDLQTVQNPDRGGVPLPELEALLDRLQELGNLKVMGLMAVAPLGEDPQLAFARLSKIHSQVLVSYPEYRYLSCGMSGDFEAAIAAGATHIRVGSSILGSREPLI
ncbi:MAG: YggS family pyridoxal phosphate-dependent enzyme [Actinomycetes bacterium]